jgi:hypothetical protein
MQEGVELTTSHDSCTAAAAARAHHVASQRNGAHEGRPPSPKDGRWAQLDSHIDNRVVHCRNYTGASDRPAHIRI